MNQKSDVLYDLIRAAYSGPVFGLNQSFGDNALGKLPIVREQIDRIGVKFTTSLSICIKGAIPDLSDAEVHRIIKEIGPKAVGFCPALTVGELTGDDNVRRLAAAATAIGTMYFADQSMDRGDEEMVSAIEKLCRPDVTPITSAVATRLAALASIQSSIDDLALSEDAPYVLDCYTEQVLYNEVLLHKLSVEYQALEEDRQQDFLSTHAKEIANLMVVDAGFPSVTTSLYAIYRQNDTALPPLSEVAKNPAIAALIQICNAVVRVADEVGDWEIDAGHHPAWGIFCINPFNQYHPDIVARFCELAEIRDTALVASLQSAFRDFHSDEEERGTYITDTFFAHVQDYIGKLPQSVQKDYGLYITLCKRVLEIGWVNMKGDKALADVEEEE